MEAIQRPTLRIPQASAAQISFGQFGNPLPPGFNNIAGLGVPPLPLSPVEFGFLDGLGDLDIDDYPIFGPTQPREDGWQFPIVA